MTDLESSLKYLLCLLLVMAFSAAQDGGSAPRSSEELRVGVYDNPPKVYTNSSGEAIGIFPEILEIIAEQEGWKLKYEQCSWRKCLDRLDRGELDIMVDIAHSQERAERFLFSEETIFLNWGTLYTGNGSTVNNLLDLNGQTIAAVKDDIHTVGEEGIQRLVSKFDLDVTFLYVDNYHEALAKVEDGSADVAVVNRLFGVLAQKKYAVKKTPIVFNPVNLRFAFPKNEKYTTLANTIDMHVERLKADPDSLFHKIVNTYLAGVEFDIAFYKEMQPINLTDEERKWLIQHKVVRLGVDKGYAPYSFRNEDGIYQGMALDIINLIARYLDIEIEIADNLDWPQIMEHAEQKKIDAILTSVPTPARRAFLNYTQIYLPTPLVIMTRDNYHELEGPEDLASKKVALVKGYFSTNLALQDHPDINPIMVDTPLDGLTAVSTGEADCYVGGLGLCDHTARMNGIANLKVAARYNMLLYGERIATRKDWPELARILEKGLNAITEKKRLEIQQSWLSSLAKLEGPALLQQNNALTAEETDWVRERKEVLLGVDPEFAPFEFIDEEGNYKGIVSEYLDILEDRVGLTFTVVPGLTWQESVAKTRLGELDMLPCIGKTDDRKDFLTFSKPYIYYQRVIITRTDTPFISSIDDLRNMKVAVQEATSHEGYLTENTEVDPISYPTLQETLKAVSEGKVDAMVGNLSSSIFWIRKENYTNLKIAGPVSYASEELHFAVTKDLPQLLTIVEKGLASLSPFKQKEIREKWVSVDYEPGLDPDDIFRYLAQGLGVVFLIFVAILFWNYRLKREISKHTGELKETNRKLREEIRSREIAEGDREIMQEQLFQAQKMEAIGTLAGGIAHDFNNILSSILGYTELALEEANQNTHLQRDLKEVYSAGLRAKDLVRQILSLSRHDTSKIKPIRIARLMEEALRMLRSTIPASIEIKENITKEPLIVEIDPTHLHQVIINLAINASHSIVDDNGILEITLDSIMITKDNKEMIVHLPPGEYARITVSDTGTGIAPQHLAKVFEPYFTTKEKGTGTGLGLSVVNTIIKRSHGHITVSSELGKGTTFTVYLPLTQNSVLETKIETTMVLPRGNERILVVDDEASIVTMQQKQLERLGYKVTGAANGVEALEAFQATPDAFALIITDMTMPKMNGDELARRIKAIRPSVPIILCTGYSEKIKHHRDKMIIDSFLTKPVDTAEMAKTIRNFLRKSNA